MDENIKLLKVSSKSKPNSVAGAIAGMIRSSSRVKIQTIGAGALNQAVKGIAIARGFIAPTGHELICIPYFKDIEVNGFIVSDILSDVMAKSQKGDLWITNHTHVNVIAIIFFKGLCVPNRFALLLLILGTMYRMLLVLL